MFHMAKKKGKMMDSSLLLYRLNEGRKRDASCVVETPLHGQLHLLESVDLKGHSKINNVAL